MKKTALFYFTALIAMLTSLTAWAQNPIIQTSFTADPAPMVYNNTVYLYTSHDENDAEGFKMLNWKLYTTRDMANWTDHGTVASLAIFPWAVQTNDAWAPQVVARNGKFYLYVPISVAGWPKNVIGVAVADKPEGPFKDALGHPLISKATGNIDPTVFIDDDGQAYLYWGNPHLWYVKLNKDMISYSGDITMENPIPHYQEGPWFYKRKGHYYMAYASTCCPEGIGYAMSESPTGPWEYKGIIMDPNSVSSGNHPGIIDFKGSSYVFGFNYTLNWALTNVHRERRSVTVSKFSYNPDGTISTLPFWDKEGVSQVGVLNPYQRVEAETINLESGIKTDKDVNGEVYVTDIDNGDYIRVKGVDFGNGARAFHADVAADNTGGRIEIHLDGEKGDVIGSLSVNSTGGKDKWAIQSCAVKKIKGVHNLYFVFEGKEGNLFNLNWWNFSK